MSISSITQNVFLEMVRGDTLGLGIQFTNLASPIDEVVLSCRTEFGSPTLVFQGSLTGGEVTTDGGNVYICIPPERTASLTPGMYVYDVEITVGDDVVTPLIGNLRILYGVTEA